MELSRRSGKCLLIEEWLIVIVYRDADQFIIKAPKRLAAVFVDDLSGKMITVLRPHQNEFALQQGH